ncbi:MAG: M55 family metallopeptidase [Elusimicrobiota bacterium]
MKIYILTDIEGVSGVVQQRQQGLSGDGDGFYQRARQWLTMEINAAVDGAKAAGADKIIVIDGHGHNGGYNVVFENLSENADYVVGTPWDKYPPVMDKSFDLLFQVGAHAMAGTSPAVLEHTMSSAAVLNYWINGKRVGELGLLSMIASDYGIPTGLVTGDYYMCVEAKKLLGNNLFAVATKKALSRTSAVCYPLSKNLREIKKAAGDAVKNAELFKLLKVKRPVELRIDFLRTDMVRRYQDKPHCKIVDNRTLVIKAGNMIEVVNIWRNA